MYGRLLCLTRGLARLSLNHVRCSPQALAADRSADLRMVARGGAINLFGALANGVFQFLLVVAVARVFNRESLAPSSRPSRSS